MHLLVTAGPTREHLDPVRFISNASSGRMGCAVAAAGVEAGHRVTLLAGGPALERAPEGCEVLGFAGVDDLRDALHERFAHCDALIMAAAVGDFRPTRVLPSKIPRSGGPITLRLTPTEDLLASLAPRRQPNQTIVAFAVEGGDRAAAERKARNEMARKGADLVVVNAPEAMAAEESEACVLGPDGPVLGWSLRPKAELAREIMRILEERTSAS